MFDDNTCFEFYCHEDDIRPTNGSWQNADEHIASYMKEAYSVTYRAEIDPVSGEVSFESHDRG